MRVRLIHSAEQASVVHIKVAGNYPTVVVYGGVVYLRQQVFEPGEGHQPHEYAPCSAHFFNHKDVHEV